MGSVSVSLVSNWAAREGLKLCCISVSVLCYFAYIVKHREYLLLCEEEAATRHLISSALYDTFVEV